VSRKIQKNSGLHLVLEQEGYLSSCSSAESLEKPCSKALTVFTHARLRAKSELGFLEFYPKTACERWKRFPHTIV